MPILIPSQPLPTVVAYAEPAIPIGNAPGIFAFSNTSNQVEPLFASAKHRHVMMYSPIATLSTTPPQASNSNAALETARDKHGKHGQFE